MTYDPGTSQFILFGGAQYAQWQGDTWTYEARWQPQSITFTNTPPSHARYSGANNQTHTATATATSGLLVTLAGRLACRPAAAVWKLEHMQKFSLDAIAREQTRKASAASSGRSAETVFGGHEHALRQTVLALIAGAALSEHENPGEATIQVLRGRVRLIAGQVAWEGRTGDLLIVPDARHAVEAIEDSAILLTVSKVTQPSRP
jgi:quercetin dioxygenase-like cupin family protein